MDTARLKKFRTWLLILLLGFTIGIMIDRFSLISKAPVVITKREEVRITEGVNYLEVMNRTKPSQVLIYLATGQTREAASGLIVASDGLVIMPAVFAKPNFSYTVITHESEIYAAKIAAVDNLTGLALLEIAAQDLPVAKQGRSRDLEPGEKLLVLKPSENLSRTKLYLLNLLAKPFPKTGFFETYDFSALKLFLETDLRLTPELLGSGVFTKDAELAGFVTQIGKDFAILRSEDIKLFLDNFLDNRRIEWPSPKLAYLILGQPQAKLLNLSQTYGILVQRAATPLLANDLIVAVDDRVLTKDDNFQELILAKTPKTAIKLKVIRGGKELELDFAI